MHSNMERPGRACAVEKVQLADATIFRNVEVHETWGTIYVFLQAPKDRSVSIEKLFNSHSLPKAIAML